MASCALCGKEVDSVTHIAEHWLINNIKEDHPEWVEKDGSCKKCIDYYKSLDDVVEKRD